MKLEDYTSKKQVELAQGGLNDYIRSLDTRSSIKFIITKLVKNKEILLDNQKLDEVIAEEVPTLTFVDADGSDVGEHDYIHKVSREQLIKWALAAEHYHRKVNNLNLLGGLHDYVENLSNEEIAKYIIKEAKEHPELDSTQALDLFVVTGSIDELHLYLEVGGLHDYIFREPREILVKWALTAEKYEKMQKEEEHLLGGLHDYIGNMSLKDIAQYILDKVNLYPKLASADELNKLYTEYGFGSG